MIWRSTARLLTAFVVAGLSVRFTPDLLTPLGLSEFMFVGQLCCAILVLSILDAVFARLNREGGPPGESPADH